MIRVGEITYANCVPVFSALRKTGRIRDVAFFPGEPAVLNRMLNEGEIDLAPCSSFEYGLHADKYLLIPGLSISAEKEVQSVLLISRRPIEELDRQTVLLSSASATSNVLIQILLKKRYRQACTFVLSEEQGAVPEARLVIGNPTLQTHLKKGEEGYVYDLALLWNEYTGLPFVFALWIIRRDAALKDPEAMSMLVEDLLKARDYAKDHYAVLAREFEPVLEIKKEDLLTYWETISYDLNREKVTCLNRYYDEAVDLGLLSQSPPLEFFQIPS